MRAARSEVAASAAGAVPDGMQCRTIIAPQRDTAGGRARFPAALYRRDDPQSREFAAGRRHGPWLRWSRSIYGRRRRARAERCAPETVQPAGERELADRVA